MAKVELAKILLSQIPSSRIHYHRRVSKLFQSTELVTLDCNPLNVNRASNQQGHIYHYQNTTTTTTAPNGNNAMINNLYYDCELAIFADGSQSKCRQLMYDNMRFVGNGSSSTNGGGVVGVSVSTLGGGSGGGGASSKVPPESDLLGPKFDFQVLMGISDLIPELTMPAKAATQTTATTLSSSMLNATLATKIGQDKNSSNNIVDNTTTATGHDTSESNNSNQIVWSMPGSLTPPPSPPQQHHHQQHQQYGIATSARTEISFALNLPPKSSNSAKSVEYTTAWLSLLPGPRISWCLAGPIGGGPGHSSGEYSILHGPAPSLSLPAVDEGVHQQVKDMMLMPLLSSSPSPSPTVAADGIRQGNGGSSDNSNSNHNGTSIIARMETFGDLIQQTRPGAISRMQVEDRFFKTVYFDRTIVIGDAWHQVPIRLC